MNWFFRYKLHHLLFWLVYFIFWTSFSAIKYGTPTPYALLITGAYFIGQASIVYSFIYWLIPKYFNNKKYLRFTIWSIIMLLITSGFIDVFVVSLIKHVIPDFDFNIASFFPLAIITNFYAALVSFAIKIINERIKTERRNKELEKAKTENELRFLKSQINPHSLFNIINSIYVLIKKDPDLAAKTLARFADMLRYQLYECNADAVPIEKEIIYLNNYIELEKLRKGSCLIIDYFVDNNTDNFLIAPLLIIPFIENAFKYVSAFNDKENKVAIKLNYQNHSFELLVENTFDENAETSSKSHEGIGLENVKRRLELIYNGRHKLIINKTDKIFTVLLNIQIL